MRHPSLANNEQCIFGFHAKWPIDRVSPEFGLQLGTRSIQSVTEIVQCGRVRAGATAYVRAIREMHGREFRVIAPVHSSSHLVATPV